MLKWIKRFDSLIRLMVGVIRVIVAVLNALDPPNNHENGAEEEAAKRTNSI